MSFQDSLRKNLTPELYASVIDQLGDDFDFDLVPRSRLNKVIKQRNDLRDQLEEGAQPSAPQSGTTSEDVEALRQQYEAQMNQGIQEVKIQYAALDKLRAANIIDPELVWSSNVLDKTKLTLNDQGALVGMDDMIAQLQRDKAHLFKPTEPPVPKGTGKTSGGEFEGVDSKEAFLKLDADRQIAFKQSNPEIFKSFMSTTN